MPDAQLLMEPALAAYLPPSATTLEGEGDLARWTRCDSLESLEMVSAGEDEGGGAGDADGEAFFSPASSPGLARADEPRDGEKAVHALAQCLRVEEERLEAMEERRRQLESRMAPYVARMLALATSYRLRSDVSGAVRVALALRARLV